VGPAVDFDITSHGRPRGISVQLAPFRKANALGPISVQTPAEPREPASFPFRLPEKM